MSNFVKIYGSILRSTVWVGQPSHVKLTWLAMLILADADGYVGSSVPGLAREAEVTIDECTEALGVFLAPDEWSRTEEHDGRRIRKVDGGWVIINHRKYREMRSRAQLLSAKRQAEFKKRRKRGTVSGGVTSVTRVTGHESELPALSVTKKTTKAELEGAAAPLTLSPMFGESVTPETGPVRSLDSEKPVRSLEDSADSEPSGASPAFRESASGEAGVTVARPGPRTYVAPEDFQPSEAHVVRAAELGLDLQLERERFVACEFERPYSDWGRRFTLWLIDARKRAESDAHRRGRGRGQQQPDHGVTGWESVTDD